MAKPMTSRDFMKVAGDSLNKVFIDEYARHNLPKYKLHMHMKKDWRILELREVHGASKYYTHSSYKSHKEAQAILKLLM